MLRTGTGLQKYAGQVASIKGKADKSYKIDFTIKDDKSVEDEYFSADVTVTIDGETPLVGDCVFQKGAWPSDKKNVIPVCFLIETQRMIRGGKHLLWAIQKDMI